jgi:hypothetical protein
MEEKCLDSVFRIIKQYNYVELDAIRYMYCLLIEKSIDLEIFNTVEREGINACSVLPITISAIFETFFRNNSITANKKYAKYYIDPRLSNYIVQKSNITPTDAVLDGNVLINGYLTYLPENAMKRTGYQIEPQITAMLGSTSVLLLEKELIYEARDRNGLKLYDKIFYHIPSDVHNITHASCAEYIKKLKIRGTSYEAVCLQMISLLLNRKGTAYITISDAFLIRDTAQIVQTRKYLAEHFNIKEIIKIDDGFYPIKEMARGSILVLEEGSKTDIINFSTLTVDNQISLKEMKYTSLDIIAKNNYKIIPQDTHKVKSCDDSLSKLDFNDIFEINNNEELKDLNELKDLKELNCLYINKQGQTTVSKNESKYMISLKTGSHQFYLFYLKYIIDNTNVDYIDKIKLPGFNRTRFDFVQEYMQNREAYQALTTRIYLTSKTLKKQLLNFYSCTTGRKLSDICKISDQWKNTDIIAILFNTLNVGRAIYNPVNTQMKSHWWLTLLPDAPFDLRYIYHYIGYYNERLQELSRTKSQNHLSQSNIQELVIPSLPLSLQQKIIIECDKYEDFKRLSFDDELLFNF